MVTRTDSGPVPGTRAPTIARSAPVARPVWLPREHGAYGQLTFPLVTALALGRPTLAAMGITVAAVAAFLAHEPLLVVTGQRGRRALDAPGTGERAWRALWVLIATGSVAGIAGLAAAPPGARVIAMVPLALAAACMVTVLRRRERTTFNEIVAAITLCALALPVAMAAGARTEAAIAAWLAWSGTFTIATGAVRGLIARGKTGGSRATAYATAVAAPAGTLIAYALARVGALPPSVAAGMLPLTLIAIGAAIRPPPARQLREVGWAIIVACVIIFVVLVATFR